MLAASKKNVLRPSDDNQLNRIENRTVFTPLREKSPVPVRELIKKFMLPENEKSQSRERSASLKHDSIDQKI